MRGGPVGVPGEHAELTDPHRQCGTLIDADPGHRLGVHRNIEKFQPAPGPLRVAGCQVVRRQSHHRGELTGIQWLGFALTEAIVFYAFIFGLIAFFLS